MHMQVIARTPFGKYVSFVCVVCSPMDHFSQNVFNWMMMQPSICHPLV